MKVPHLHDFPRDLAMCERWIAILDEEIAHLEHRLEAGAKCRSVLIFHRERRNWLRRWRGMHLETANRERRKIRELNRRDVEADDTIRLLGSMTNLAQRYLKLLYGPHNGFAIRPYDAALMREATHRLEERFGKDWPHWHQPEAREDSAAD